MPSMPSLSPVSARPAALSRAILMAAAAVMGVAVAAAIGLWAHYGTAVFFETIRAGVAACL